MSCAVSFILFTLFALSNDKKFELEVCNCYCTAGESAVLSMAAMSDLSYPQQRIRTIITPHRTRLVNYDHYRNQQYHHYARRESSLITIHRSRKGMSKYQNTTCTSLPRVLASNVQSITKPKHAELVQQSVDYDMMLITESWLKPNKTNAFGIPGLRLVNVNRAGNRTGGGVCMYVRDSLSTSLVSSYTSTTTSAMWVALHQENQNMIIYACIYHPPGLKKSACDETVDYIIGTVSSLSSRFPSAQFVIHGDFNDLDVKPITDMLPLKQIVSFPTHKQNKIDLVFTDVQWYCDNPESTCLSAPPIGRSDHSSIILTSTLRHKTRYQGVKKRDITEKSKIGISTDLASQSWEHVMSETNPDSKAEIFQQTVSSIVEKWCPIKTVRVPVGKKPITTPLIQKLRRA